MYAYLRESWIGSKAFESNVITQQHNQSGLRDLNMSALNAEPIDHPTSMVDTAELAGSCFKQNLA